MFFKYIIYYILYLNTFVRISVKHKKGMTVKSAILIFDIFQDDSLPTKTFQPSSS